MHFHDKKDDVEKWKGHNSGCALLSLVRGSVFGLILRMTVHAFKRYWRLLWICSILTGTFWVFYILFQNNEPSIEIREEAPPVNEKNIFHRSLNERLALKIERQERPSNPPISPEFQQNKHIEIENRINIRKSVENKRQVDIKKTRTFQNRSKKLNRVFVKKHQSFDKHSNDINKLEKKDKSSEIITQNTAKITNIKTPTKNSDLLSKHTNSLNQTKAITVTKIRNENKQFPKYYDDNLRPLKHWKFNTSRHYDNKLLRYWSEPIRLDISNASAPGENGTGFVASKDEVELMRKLRDEQKFNVLASDRISLRRSLPDFRSAECRNLIYPEKLPTVSVVIVFHNEVWSTLFRTVWSIIDRSPPELVEEIILVDDESTWIFLQRPLDDYVKTLPARVKVIRIAKREGLIRARLVGARAAEGSVLTFFDAHTECTDGWLPPILARIASDRSVAVVPIIDAISSNDMSYIPTKTLKINGLRWHLLFHWMKIPQRELNRTQNDKTAPLRIPSHIGCAFSVDREFFFEIGSYDEGMDIWGSENVELAFRVWLCGGSLEILPCSRVAHLYRESTYSFNGDAEVIKNRNNNRLVEVFMDEFKEFFYAANPASRKILPGNLTERFNLKKRLQCKNFRWYLDNIYPESNWRRKYIMMGQLKNLAARACLDVYTTEIWGKVIVLPCHGLGRNQFFAFAESGQIISAEELCIGIDNKTVILVRCLEEDKSQYWKFDQKERWIIHKESSLCMQNNRDTDVIIGVCNSTDIQSKWDFKSNWQKHVPMVKKLTLGKGNLINRLGNS